MENNVKIKDVNTLLYCTEHLGKKYFKYVYQNSFYTRTLGIFKANSPSLPFFGSASSNYHDFCCLTDMRRPAGLAADMDSMSWWVLCSHRCRSLGSADLMTEKLHMQGEDRVTFNMLLALSASSPHAGRLIMHAPGGIYLFNWGWPQLLRAELEERFCLCWCLLLMKK